MSNIVTTKGEILQDPPIVQTLLNDPRAGLVWFFLRIWLGWQWVHTAWLKLQDPAWTSTGEAMRSFWQQMVAAPDTPGWYQAIMQALLNAEAWTWFGKVVLYTEFIVGIALILGLFTGVAAFLGAFISWNFIMSGSISANPIMFVIALGLIMAWKVAGYVGFDFILLPWLGTPWHGKPLRLLSREWAITSKNDPADLEESS